MERETKARTRPVQYVTTVLGNVPTCGRAVRRGAKTCAHAKEVGEHLTSLKHQFTMCIGYRQCIDARKRLVRGDTKTHTERKGFLSPHRYLFSNRQYRSDDGRRTDQRERMSPFADF